MRFSNLLLLQLLAVGTITVVHAQDSSYTRVETRSSSTSSSSSTSTGSSDKSGTNQGGTVETVTFTDKKVFVPKFKERIKNLKEQVDFSLGKGFITQDESAQFHSRLTQLHAQEEDLAKKGYPKGELDVLEKGITGLNSDLFKASNKPAADKPGTTTTGGASPAAAPATAPKSTGATAEGAGKPASSSKASSAKAPAPAAKKTATSTKPAAKSAPARKK